MADLGENQQGRPITGVSFVLRKTGDGLSESVDADPDMILDSVSGDEGVVAFEYRVYKVGDKAESRQHPALGGVVRVVEADALTAVFLDPDTIAKAIRIQKDKNQRLADERAGTRQLFSEPILVAEHEEGKHKRYVDGCPECDAAREAAALRAEEDAAASNDD